MGKITALEHLRACAVASRNFVTGLIGEVAGTVADALEELDRAKANKPSSTAVTIPTSGWGTDSSVAAYPKYYDIAVTGVTAKDRAEISILPGSMDAAKACGLCPASQTLAGKIRVRATKVPTAAIVAEYWIENGKE